MEKKRTKVVKHRFNGAIAATAAAVIAIPAATVAVTHLHSAEKTEVQPGALVETETVQEEVREEETAALAVTEEETLPADAEAEVSGNIIEAEEEYQAEAEPSEPDEEAWVPEFTLNLDAVPDIFIGEGLKYHYNDGEYHAGGITINLPRHSWADMDEYVAELNEVTNCAGYDTVNEFDVGEGDDVKHVYVGWRSDIGKDGSDFTTWENGWFNRDVLVVFGDTGRSCGLFVYSEITDEDLIAFIDALEIEE